VESLKGKDQSLPREVVIATRNEGKLREIKDILVPWSLKILSLKDFPGIPEIIEDGSTFAQNAAKKAREVARQTGRVAIADDSGLVVEALQGRPGVFSSRYGGEKATDEERFQKLLAEMTGIPEGKRQAAFVCTIALATPQGQVELLEGRCRGQIAFAPRGKHGFGYDPIFFLPELGKTMAELDPELKNRISHRARALEKLKELLPTILINL
jgi:XTP/dITP diphosphohydrolase